MAERLDLTYKGEPVVDLLPTAMTKKVVGPEDDVILINRGREPIADTYDGVNYVIPPQVYCRLKYAAALHFQLRRVVPGTRNPLAVGPTQKQQSFIGICDLDPPEKCAPFTDADVARYSGIAEAIDRSVLDPGDRDVTRVSTNAVAASLPGAGAGGGRKPVLGGDLDALAEVPVDENAAVAEIAASTRESAMEKAAASMRARVRPRPQQTEVEA